MSIIEGLEGILEEKLVSFHVPGHKGRDLFPDILNKNIQRIDVTEFSGTDNLHHPQEMILEAQNRAAKTFGAHRTYFLVNGTTVGIQAMILAICKPGDEILIPRNCHRSIWSALIIGGIRPVYIAPEVHPITGVGLSVSPEAIQQKLKEYPNIKAVVITYPTYYGTCSDIEKISQILHNENKVLLVDEAHGAHLSFHKELPISALEGGADITVQSTHKILSSFTQSSMLHVGSKNISMDMLEMFLGMLQSSSPSYSLMASLDFAAQQAEEQGYEKWNKILQWTEKARMQINTYTSMRVKGRDMIGDYGVKNFDNSKLWIDVSPIGLRGTEVDEILRKEYGIQVELSDYYHILAMTGMGTEEEDIERLVKALIHINQIETKHEKKIPTIPLSTLQEEMVLSPREAVYAMEEEVSLEQAVGRISKEFIIPYPPGIPLVLPGERITKEIMNSIKDIKKWGGQIIGTHDYEINKIKVIKS